MSNEEEEKKVQESNDNSLEPPRTTPEATASPPTTHVETDSTTAPAKAIIEPPAVAPTTTSLRAAEERQLKAEASSVVMTARAQQRDITQKVHAYTTAHNNDNAEPTRAASPTLGVPRLDRRVAQKVHAHAAGTTKLTTSDQVVEKSDDDDKASTTKHGDYDQAAQAGTTTVDVNRGVVQPPALPVHTTTPARKRKQNPGDDEELAVAQPVYEKVTSAELMDDDEEEKTPLYKQIVFILLMALVIALGVGVSLGVTKPWENDSLSSIAILENEGPTGAPTMAPTSLGPLLLKEELTTLLTREIVKSSQEAFDSAVQWFFYDELRYRNTTNDDPDDEAAARRQYLLLGDEGAEYKLQRFVLAWFWHHTTDNGRKPWISCNKPVGDETDECDHLEASSILVINDEPVICYSPVPSLRWLTSTDECEWEGIMCYSNGDVAVIELYAVGVTGKFPEFLHVVERLQVIRLSYGGLSGTFPNNMDKLTGLRELSLIGNLLEGPIPETFFKMDLRNMNVAFNQFRGTIPTEIGSFPALAGLYLFNNQFEVNNNNLTGTLPPSWANLSQLIQFHAHDNAIGGTIPQEWSNLTGLLEVRLYNNEFYGPLIEMDWPGLIGIFLDGNRFTGTFPEDNNRALQYIDLSKNDFSGTLQDRFDETGLNSLIVLSLDNNQFSGTIPQSLEKLGVSIVSIFYNNFTGPVPEGLCNKVGPTGLVFLEADCDGDPPDNECSCCTYCCDPDNRTCRDIETARRLNEEKHVRDDFDIDHEFIPNSDKLFPKRRHLQTSDSCTAQYVWKAETGDLVLFEEATL
eukprot:scaffold3043_cov180-Amphora_coffeaeformis.AAC.25